ncbi:MAG: FAD-binding oxidoreductase, partial [Eubacteriales bacterium]|nr:FAD-binding oxidoreductase [Eubacteriales bacterium]
VMISTEKMNRIKAFDPENMLVTIEPGVLLFDLAEACRERGLLYPPDPGEKYATVGGNVSTNAGGMRAVLYGATRDYVRSMEVVYADGTVTRLGANVCKTSTGYSLVNLMVGSEGTLGIITELTLRLLPAPGDVASLVIPFEDLDACIRTVPKLKLSKLRLQAIEFMEREMVLTSERHLGKSVFPQMVGGTVPGAYLLVTVEADDEEILAEKIEAAADLVLEAGAIDVLVADNPSKMRDVWATRSGFIEAIKAEFSLMDECDVVVPVASIAEYLAEAKKAGARAGVSLRCYGHAGDGNLHIKLCANDMDPAEFARRCSDCFEEIYEKAVDFGGLLSGEHGIGHGKLPYLARFVGEENVRLMERIKRAFDPNMILNPGKVCYPV